jgi:hypothetical protein
MAKAILIASAALSLFAVVPAASADTRPPPIPSIAQYVEMVPTSGGAVVPTGPAHVRLSKQVAEQLPKSAEGTALRVIATRAAYGAPQRKFHASKHAVAEARRAVMAPKAEVSSATFSAAVDAVGARRNLVLWLGIVVLATAAFGAGAAVVRARR